MLAAGKVMTLMQMTNNTSYKKWVSPDGVFYDSETKAISIGKYKATKAS